MTTPIPRTQDQIAARIHAITDAGLDHTGTERSRLLEALDIEHAKQFLRPEARSAWERVTYTIEDARDEMRGYLPFAWSKANQRRGASAIRSLAFFRGLLWLIGEDDLVDAISVEYFGKAMLASISHMVGYDWRVREIVNPNTGETELDPQRDDDQWVEWVNAGDREDPDLLKHSDPMTATEALEAANIQLP